MKNNIKYGTTEIKKVVDNAHDQIENNGALSANFSNDKSNSPLVEIINEVVIKVKIKTVFIIKLITMYQLIGEKDCLTPIRFFITTCDCNQNNE